jgi:hypothetical protein
MLLWITIEMREYTDPRGRSPFQQWFEDLDARAAAKVTVALTRLEQATCPIRKAWAAVSWNYGSTMVRATASTSEKMVDT